MSKGRGRGFDSHSARYIFVHSYLVSSLPVPTSLHSNLLLLLPLPFRNHRLGLSLTFKAQSLRSARLLPSPALLLCVTFFTLVTLSPSMMVSSLSSFSSRAWTSLRHFPDKDLARHQSPSLRLLFCSEGMIRTERLVVRGPLCQNPMEGIEVDHCLVVSYKPSVG